MPTNALRVGDPQVVFVTGASRGMGFALAQELAQRGHQVIATMRHPDRDGPAVRKGFEKQIQVTACDVTDRAAVDRAVAFALQQHGRIDALVNNAAYTLYGPTVENTDEEIRGQFETNVTGVIRCVQAVVPTMRDQGGGKILNVSSIAAKIAGPLFGVYCGTKAALDIISEALRYELARWNIQVTLVAPGIVKTDNQWGSLDVAQTIRDKRSAYQATAEDMLEQVRNVASTRPGGRLMAVSVADLIEINQPLPLRVPVGEDTMRAFAARAAVTDDEWEAMLWSSQEEGFPAGFFRAEAAARTR